MNKHLHWEFVCGELGPVEGSFKNASFVVVTDCSTEEQALVEVKKILTRSVYHLKQVFECQTCLFQEEMLKNQSNHIKRVEKRSGIEKKAWEKDDDETT